MVWNIGFDDGMGVTYSMKELDGDIRKIEYVDTTREMKTVGGGFEMGKLNCGRPIKPDNVPTKFEWGGPKNRKLPDAIYGRQMLLVSDRVKAIVEQFEPEVHQFFPIDVIYKSNNELARKMFFLNICTRLDSVDHELSTVTMEYNTWDPATGVFVFNLDQIGDHHLWRDKHIYYGLMISDALHDAMTQECITGLVFNKDKTNVEWQPWR
jgi:hypothetical protein